MHKCILIVTPDEFDLILPLTHGFSEWSNYNRDLLTRLENVLGRDIVHDIRQYHFCQMVKQSDVTGIRRVQIDRHVA